MPQVSEIMSSDVLSIKPTAPVLEALRMMSGAHVRHIPVVGDDGMMVGIVSDRDAREFGDADDVSTTVVMRHLNMPVSEVMTSDPRSIAPSASLDQAAAIMIDTKVGALPVVDGGKVVGILSVIDLLAWVRGQGTLDG